MTAARHGRGFYQLPLVGCVGGDRLRMYLCGRYLCRSAGGLGWGEVTLRGVLGLLLELLGFVVLGFLIGSDDEGHN